MKKNEYNIKQYYYSELMKFFNSLESIPESEKRYEKIEEFMRKVSKPYLIILAYYFERIISGEEANHYFLEQDIDNDLNLYQKINPIQLKYSAKVLRRNQEIFENVNNFIYSLDRDTSRFIISYYVNKNLTGIRVKDVVKLFDKFKLNKYLIEPELTDFNYDIEYNYKAPKKAKKLKLPCALYRDEGKLIYFHKVGSEIKTNLDEELTKPFIVVMENYKRLSMVGIIEDNVFKAYICTTKKKVVEGLFKGNYTLQNSFRYLLQDVNRVNTSLSKWNDYIELVVQKATPILIYSFDDLEYEFGQGAGYNIALFRNEFIEINSSSVKSYIVQEYDKNRIILTDYNNENLGYNLEELQQEVSEYTTGDIATIIKINKHKILN